MLRSLIIIEDYISGETLEQMIENKYSFSNEQIRKLAIQLCAIIKSLHACVPPIIHRDIKPSNIIITPFGELFLLDFNAAKYLSNEKTEDTVLLGTKGYAAPEQYGFGVSTTQTDIYAIGMLLKDLTSCDTYLESQQKNIFSSIIDQCTQLNPNERYKDIQSLLRILCNGTSPINKQQKTYPRWISYLPPGFQKLSPLRMFFSSIGYAFVFWLCLSLEVTNSTPKALMIERFFCLLIFLCIIFCSANYRNIQSQFPPCRTNNKFLRVLAIIFLDVLIFLAFIFLMLLIEAIVL